MSEEIFSRRQALQIFGAFAGPCLMRGQAQQLPLNTTGLEHIEMTVPDPEATAKFYGRVFDPQLFQAIRTANFFVRTGISYLSIGGPAAAAAPGPPRIDHFCALVQDYNPEELGKALQSAGVRFTTGPLGRSRDPVDADGLRLQLYGVSWRTDWGQPLPAYFAGLPGGPGHRHRPYHAGRVRSGEIVRPLRETLRPRNSSRQEARACLVRSRENQVGPSS